MINWIKARSQWSLVQVRKSNYSTQVKEILRYLMLARHKTKSKSKRMKKILLILVTLLCLQSPLQVRPRGPRLCRQKNRMTQWLTKCLLSIHLQALDDSSLTLMEQTWKWILWLQDKRPLSTHQISNLTYPLNQNHWNRSWDKAMKATMKMKYLCTLLYPIKLNRSRFKSRSFRRTIEGLLMQPQS